MSSDFSLFGDDDVNEIASEASEPPQPTLPEWQIAQLRQALDTASFATQKDRRRVVVELAGREVESLRDLTSSEARSVLAGLTTRATTTSTSSWDDRDEDTWIDRL